MPPLAPGRTFAPPVAPLRPAPGNLARRPPSWSTTALTQGTPGGARPSCEEGGIARKPSHDRRVGNHWRGEEAEKYGEGEGGGGSGPTTRNEASGVFGRARGRRVPS